MGPIVGLDVGTTKVACFIALSDDDGLLRVTGASHQRALGMRAGQVIDMAGLEASLRAAVDAAEQMAELRIGRVYVSITGGGLTSRNVEASLGLGNHPVRDQDVRRVLEHGRQALAEQEARAGHHGPAAGFHGHQDRELIHCLPISYAIDGGDGVIDPRGMFGEVLGVRLHAVSTGVGPWRNLATVIERCHLQPEDRVASPYASALACTVDDEKDMGVTVIDMGGGTTSLSVFVDGHPIHADSLPIGGQHVTNDIAKGLSVGLDLAERLKTKHASVLPSPADSRELLRVVLVGEEEDEAGGHEIPRSDVVRVVRPRLEETFELVRERLTAAGMLHAAGRRVVLTGGASELQGVREMAELILDKQVRLGRPRRLRGAPDSMTGPAFATCAGLLRYAIQDHVVTGGHGTSLGAIVPAAETDHGEDRRSNPLRRAVAWLRENF
jgi:cell division protein FtsA